MAGSAHAIFICYRRDDSAAIAGRLYDHLALAFGADAVFMDVDAIPLGIDFRDFAADALGRCRAVLIVIGREWLTAAGPDGCRRLDEIADHVRVEVAAALCGSATVIPVLVDGARMPRAAELPEELKPLAFRNGLAVRNDPDFRKDAGKLIRAVRELLDDADLLATLPPRRERLEKVQPEAPAGAYGSAPMAPARAPSSLPSPLAIGAPLLAPAPVRAAAGHRWPAIAAAVALFYGVTAATLWIKTGDRVPAFVYPLAALIGVAGLVPAAHRFERPLAVTTWATLVVAAVVVGGIAGWLLPWIDADDGSIVAVALCGATWIALWAHQR